MRHDPSADDGVFSSKSSLDLSAKISLKLQNLSSRMPSIPFSAPYTVPIDQFSIVPRITPASDALIAAVGPPD